MACSANSQNNEVLKTCTVIAKCTLTPDFKSSNYESSKIKKGDSVDVLDFNGSEYKVRYKGKVGFINEVFVYDKELNDLIAKREKERQAKKQEEKRMLEEERNTQNEIAKYKKQLAIKEKKKWDEQRKIRLIEKYGDCKGQLIFENQIRIGWSEAEVLESMGQPKKINTTRSASGSREQWVYQGENYDFKYLYFDNGILTTIQE